MYELTYERQRGILNFAHAHFFCYENTFQIVTEKAINELRDD